MAGELRNFDPDKVTVTWAYPGGALDLTDGLIDGPGAIAESKDAAPWSRRSDRNGNMVRNKSRKKGGTLTLTYVNEAPIHDVLSGIAIVDDKLQTQVGEITVKDLNGTTIMVYAGSFIENDPTESWGDTAGDRVWVFGYANRVPFHGGSEAL